MAHALELLDITVTFRSKDDPRQRHTAVGGTTLRIGAGEF
ncbi:MAG TPA: ABC transporter ATP-binding protein, partial [Ramlibacter sp.]